MMDKVPLAMGQVVCAPDTIAKSEEFVPAIMMLAKFSPALPRFVIVEGCGTLVFPGNTFPKLSAVGERFAMGAGGVPVPVRVMVCREEDAPPELSVMSITSVNEPSAVGSKA